MNKIVITCGYMGSGSSAATDFVSEIDGFDNNNGDFEYILLHCPDGVFDLEDKLLLGNCVVRSDEALHRFSDCMKTLFDRKNFWPGMYKKRVSNDFFNITKEFIADLTDFKFDDTVYWYFQQIPDTYLLQIRYYMMRFIKRLFHNQSRLHPILKYKGMSIAYPSSKSFYKAAQKYLNNFYQLLGYNEHNLLLDQFLLPHNLYRIKNYFDDNVRIIVVDRDPRDVFVLNKYIWLKSGCPVAYPVDVETFCDYYEKMRASERMVEDDRIVRIHFEDLIYNYEETEKKICTLLDISTESHLQKKIYFNPEKSIVNTQVFAQIKESSNEVKYIENKLGKYIYHFPHPINCDIKNAF